MPVSPNGFAAEKMSYGILTSLGLLTEQSYLPYVQEFPDLAGKYYILALEATPGVLQRSPQKRYKSYRKSTKPLNAFRVTADATGAAGSVITVTVHADDHMGGGTLSPPSIGMIFEDNATGIHYEVVDVDRSTPGAHTVDLAVATDATTVPNIVAATSYLMSHGRPSVQEDSFQQEGEYDGWTPYFRDHTAIRVNEKYTDLAMFEELDINGQTYYQLNDGRLERRFWDYNELRLMFGPQYANLQATGNENNEFEGVIPIVQAEGTTITPSGGVISDSYFEDVSLSLSANGWGKVYDGLADPIYMIELQKYFRNFTGVQGAVSYGSLAEGELKLNFDFADRFTYFGVDYDIKSYAFFNRALTHGADIGTGVWDGSLLLIPQRQYDMGNGATIRSIAVKYLADPRDPSKVVWQLDDGGLIGKNTNMNLELALESWKSIDIPLPQEFIFSQI